MPDKKPINVLMFDGMVPSWLVEQKLIGWDIETTPISDNKVPVPVLVSFGIEYNGQYHALICKPEQAIEVFEKCNQTTFLAYNVGFDFSVLYLNLVDQRPRFVPLLKRCLDVMLFDILISLAKIGDLRYRKLVDLVPWLNKNQEIRTTFNNEVLENPHRFKDWLEYAGYDAAVLPTLFKEQLEEAKAIADRVGLGANIHKLWPKFGPLTLRIQSSAAIVLALIGQTGMPISQEQWDKAKQEIDTKIFEIAKALDAYNLCKKYKKKDRKGQWKTTKSGCPQFNLIKLEEAILNDIKDHTRLSRTATGRLAVDSKTLQTLSETTNSEVVKLYSEFQNLRKLQGFFATEIVNGRIKTNYTPLVRTGRTSAWKTNIQQWPKQLRHVFEAPKGKVFLICDYKFIELVTLAACLRAKLGWSRLYDVLKKGIDPHVYTAKMLVSNWDALSDEDKKYFRQAAKAINFGTPGGLGVTKLRDYAKWTFGISLTQEQTSLFRSNLITKIYPELKLWLQEDIYKNISQSTGVPYSIVKRVLSKNDVREIRQGVIHEHLDKLKKYVKYPITFSWHLVEGTSISLTGRVRWPTSYTEYRNTKFQGLAADGAKTALVNLWLAGYQICCFIHDEIVIEIDEHLAEKAKNEVKKIMIDSMRFVLDDPEAAVDVEIGVSRTWQK